MTCTFEGLENEYDPDRCCKNGVVILTAADASSFLCYNYFYYNIYLIFKIYKGLINLEILMLIRSLYYTYM